MSTPNLAHQESTQTLIPPRPSPSHSIHKPVPKLPPRTLKDRIPQLGWWWESGAVFVSFVCMSLIVAILLTMDGKPMRIWTLPIQPNSLIAVFSTITKSALLVAIAESIGQLKWGYFDRPRNIRHMQTFDEASRGPWGAFAFLWRTRGTSVLATFGSAITVLMLGFEPFAQQIIELHTKEAVLLDTTGFVASTNSFTSSALTGNKETRDVLGFSQELFVPMVIGLLGSILGPSNPMPNNAYCPTLKCSVEDFTSLAICDFCEIEEINLDKDSEHCYYEIQKGFPKNASLPVWEGRAMTGLLPNGTISGPLGLHAGFKAAVAEAEEGSVWVRQCTINRDNTDVFQLNLQMTPQFVRGSQPSGEVRIARNENQTFILVEPSPNGTWYRTMELKYGSHSQGELIGVDYLSWTTPGSTPSTEGQPLDRISACGLEPMLGGMSAAANCFTTTSDLPAVEQLDNFGELKGTMTRCHPDLCARRYENVSVGSSGNKRVTKTTDTHLTITKDEADRIIWEAVPKDGSNITFYYETLSSMLLWGQFEATIEAKNFQGLLNQNLPRARDDWAKLWARLMDVLTDVIQSPINPDATRIYGDAYGPEIFVRVRWEWFIVPLSLVVGSNVFLCLTIYHCRKNPYLYKNSVMAILFHGLEGWEAHDLIPAKRPGKETFHDIMDTAGRMRASLRRNSDGVLKLKKE